jgi:hypothetical protein
MLAALMSPCQRDLPEAAGPLDVLHTSVGILGCRHGICDLEREREQGALVGSEPLAKLLSFGAATVRLPRYVGGVLQPEVGAVDAVFSRCGPLARGQVALDTHEYPLLDTQPPAKCDEVR